MQTQQTRINRGVTVMMAVTTLMIGGLVAAPPATAQEPPRLPIPIADGSHFRPPQRPRPRPRPRPMRDFATKDMPTWEVGIQGGLWDLAGSNFGGGRVARNFGNWLGIEAFADGRHGSGSIPSYRLTGTNLRLSQRLSTKLGTPYWVYLSVGAATGSGLGYRYSPLIGGGVQTAWAGPGARGRVAFRVELQKFTRGDTVSNDGRLLMGAAIGFGH